MPPVIELRDVTCRGNDGRVIFENVNLSLSGGEKVLITAPIASGKSTLLRLIAGLVKPDSGEVRVFGKDIASLDFEELNRLRVRIGFVFQDNALISNLKVIENVSLPLLYHTQLAYEEAMEKARDLLDLSGYRGDPWVLPGPLPMYAKKEVAMARALSMDPDVIVCENLWEGLTEMEREHLAKLLLWYLRTGSERLLVFTANNETDARLISPGRVIRIEGNKIVEQSAG